MTSGVQKQSVLADMDRVLSDDFNRAGPTGQAADEAALLEPFDDALDAGHGLETERFSDLAIGGSYAFVRGNGGDKVEDLSLAGRHHDSATGMPVARAIAA
ncbi:hypothetical protein CHELA1G11_12010 [Hyphomicrobiales bacterium]|nr:hypothetical protein CHELA1G11_12010 [Hyphomicrobiales bacterium]CAH1663920.1 hypothetical protein CHELA1G2_12302 [Hyphomicrobiales bacterium]